jgi:hypothetical protein
MMLSRHTDVPRNNIGLPTSLEPVSSDTGILRCIRDKIIKIINERSFADPEWVKVISSQYVLLNLAKHLKMTNDDSYNILLQHSVDSFQQNFRDGKYKLAKDRILIIPNENQKLIEQMDKEDEDNGVYNNTRHAAKNIEKPDIIYSNYLYGLMVSIASAEEAEVLVKIKETALNELFQKTVLDRAGGWLLYRLPWITARILISLRNVNYSLESNKDFIDETINIAIKSLIDRKGQEPFWTSGAGTWVLNTESTALCLEALMVYNRIVEYKGHIDCIINYFLIRTPDDWLNYADLCSDPDTSNKSLASVMLASVIYRICKKYYIGIYHEQEQRIIQYFSEIMSQLEKLHKVKYQQHSTIPTILYYIALITEDSE